jgi:hypothetical protein
MVMKNCTSSKMGQRHISRFLFICGLTAILLVCGLAVEDQQNGLCAVLILLHEMLGNSKCADLNQ